MALWQVKTEGNLIQLGSVTRKRLTPEGCNEPFKDRFWCPRKKWFRTEPCPFMNKNECYNMSRWAGGL